MSYSATVSASELLMSILYKQLLNNNDLSTAIHHARIELYNNKKRRGYFDQKIDLEDWLLPVIYQNRPLKFNVREYTPEEEQPYYKRNAEEESLASPELQYGFVGRDIDILQIEKRLLTKRNILLIQGLGGAGKTTLLKHVSAWWHTTGFVEQVFYFSYDERAWMLQHIMDTIAQHLLDPTSYKTFQNASLADRQKMLTSRLSSENHLLILDNLESITGTHLAIQHTL